MNVDMKVFEQCLQQIEQKGPRAVHRKVFKQLRDRRSKQRDTILLTHLLGELNDYDIPAEHRHMVKAHMALLFCGINPRAKVSVRTLEIVDFEMNGMFFYEEEQIGWLYQQMQNADEEGEEAVYEHYAALELQLRERMYGRCREMLAVADDFINGIGNHMYRVFWQVAYDCFCGSMWTLVSDLLLAKTLITILAVEERNQEIRRTIRTIL